MHTGRRVDRNLDDYGGLFLTVDGDFLLVDLRVVWGALEFVNESMPVDAWLVFVARRNQPP